MTSYVSSPFKNGFEDPEEVSTHSTRTFDNFILKSTQNLQYSIIGRNKIEAGVENVSVNNESINQVPVDKEVNNEPLPVQSGYQKPTMFYGIEDVPSWHLIIFLGFQHYLLMAGITLSLPLILMSAMYMESNDPDTGNIISTFLFVSGIVTILQSTFGTRLPIIQGGSYSFIIPAIALLNTERWKCPPKNFMTPENRTEIWQIRMREIQGAIIMSSFIQIALGASGIFGYIMHRITPITLASAVIAIGLSLLEIGSELCATYWPISITTIIFLIIFSQYLQDFKIPIPFTRSERQKEMLRYPMFQIFPVLLSIIFSWILCAVLTITDALPENHAARTDAKIEIMKHAGWFRLPLPFQWGTPTFTVSAAIGFISAVIAGIVESLREYQGTARILGAPNLPQHAINRGVFIEGVGCLLCGVFGTGNGTTSYSENTGAISITKVGSRRVIQMAGFIMMVVSVVGKLGAFFVTIPDPIIGGIVSASSSIIVAGGLSNLQTVNLTSSRNLFIVGFSVSFALAISKWVTQNTAEFNFANEELNITLQIILRSAMFIAAVISFILDGTIPGTPEERGLAKTSITTEQGLPKEDEEGIYNLPFGMAFLRRKKITSRCPISPTFKGWNCTSLLKIRKTKPP